MKRDWTEIMDPDEMAAKREAGTLKDLRSRAQSHREDGNHTAAAELEADAAEIVGRWRNTRFDVEQIAKGI